MVMEHIHWEIKQRASSDSGKYEEGNFYCDDYQDDTDRTINAASTESISFYNQTSLRPYAPLLFWEDIPSTNFLSGSANILHSSTLCDKSFSNTPSSDSIRNDSESSLFMQSESESCDFVTALGTTTATATSYGRGHDLLSKSEPLNGNYDEVSWESQDGAVATTELLLIDDNDRTKQKKPKRPLSAYNFFFQYERQAILQKMPTRVSCKPRNSHGKIGFAELTRGIAAKWKSLSSNEKMPFVAMAVYDKKRFFKEKKNWKKNNQVLKVGEVVAACIVPSSNQTPCTGVRLSLSDDKVKTGLGAGSSFLNPSMGSNESPSILQTIQAVSDSPFLYSKKFGKVRCKLTSKDVISRSLNTASAARDPRIADSKSCTLYRSDVLQNHVTEELNLAENYENDVDDMTTQGITGIGNYSSRTMEKRSNRSLIQSSTTNQKMQQEEPTFQVVFDLQMSADHPQHHNLCNEQIQHQQHPMCSIVQYQTMSTESSSSTQFSALARKLDDDSTEFFLDLFH